MVKKPKMDKKVLKKKWPLFKTMEYNETTMKVKKQTSKKFWKWKSLKMLLMAIVFPTMTQRRAKVARFFRGDGTPQLVVVVAVVMVVDIAVVDGSVNDAVSDDVEIRHHYFLPGRQEFHGCWQERPLGLGGDGGQLLQLTTHLLEMLVDLF